MVIFISWSGEMAKEIAELLKEELERIFGEKNLKIFVSSLDIAAGSEWFIEISKAIEDSVCGILCLTKENTTDEGVADWIEFEAGALAFHLKGNGKAVIPMLFDVKMPNETPLKIFEFVRFECTQYVKFISDLNNKYLGKALKENQISDLAKVSFKERLQPNVEKIMEKYIDSDKIEVFPRGDLRISSGTMYLSCPMNSIKDDEYENMRLFVMEINEVLKESCGISEIYAPIVELEQKDDFDGPEKAATDNFEKLKKAEVLLCIYPKPMVTSVLSEIGYAIALHKKIIIFTLKRYRDKLPYILQDGEKSFSNIKIYTYNKNEEVIKKIRKNGKTFLR